MKSLFCLLMVMTAFTVTTFSQLFKRSLDNFEPGYYYDSSGNKVQGLLKFKYGGGWSSKKNGDCVLIFKKDKGDNKQTFTPLDINSFVIGLDSFGIVRNFSLTAFANYPLDFTKVEAAGKINLYTYYALSHSGGQNSVTTTRVYYLVEKDGKVITVKKIHFQKLLRELYFNDYPQLKDKLGSRKQSVDDLPGITRLYNQHFVNVALTSP